MAFMFPSSALTLILLASDCKGIRSVKTRANYPQGYSWKQTGY